jgi:hypothetical protein
MHFNKPDIIDSLSLYFSADLSLLTEEPPSLELVVPVARKLSGACEEQCGVQNLAILAFWYLLISVVLRKRLVTITSYLTSTILASIYTFLLALFTGQSISHLPQFHINLSFSKFSFLLICDMFSESVCHF